MSSGDKDNKGSDDGKTAVATTVRRSSRTRSASLTGVESLISSILVVENTRRSPSSSLGTASASILKNAISRARTSAAASTSPPTKSSTSGSTTTSTSSSFSSSSLPSPTQVSLTVDELDDLVTEISSLRTNAIRSATTPLLPDAPTFGADDDDDVGVLDVVDGMGGTAPIPTLDKVLVDLRRTYDNKHISFVRRHHDMSHTWRSPRNKEEGAFVARMLDWLKSKRIPHDESGVDYALRRLLGIEINEEMGGWHAMKALDNWSNRRLISLEGMKALMRDIKMIKSVEESSLTTTTQRPYGRGSSGRGRGGRGQWVYQSSPKRGRGGGRGRSGGAEPAIPS